MRKIVLLALLIYQCNLYAHTIILKDLVGKIIIQEIKDEAALKKKVLLPFEKVYYSPVWVNIL